MVGRGAGDDLIAVRRAPALSAIEPVHANRRIAVKQQQELPVPEVTDDDVRAYMREREKPKTRRAAGCTRG